MKLYVCYGTSKYGPFPKRHPCGLAYHALKDAGYEPEVKLSYGLGLLPGVLNDLTPGRRKVKELTGNYWVPVLVTDGGDVIQGSEKIVRWAETNPASAAGATAGPASTTR